MNPHAKKMVPDWYHFHCFWFMTQYHNDVNVTNMKGFNALRWEDQQKIKDMIAGGADAVDNMEVKGNYHEYSVEYAKSGRSVCRGCPDLDNIPKDAIRFSRLDYDSEGVYYAHQPVKFWYCMDCFVRMRRKLGFFEDLDPKKIPGFTELKKKDQGIIVDTLKKGASKRKAEDDAAEGTSDAKIANKDETKKEKELREQNEALWKIRDNLEQNVTVDIMKTLLQHNNQVVPQQKKNVLDLLSDCMVFGAFAACEDCGGRDFMFREAEGLYLCVGIKNDEKPCDRRTKVPTREEFKIPEDCQEVEFLMNYKYVPRKRVYPEVSVNLTPLTGLSFVVGNKTYAMKEVLVSQLRSLGAEVVSKPQLGLSACISSKEEFNSKNSRIMKACKVLKIPIISEHYLKACRNGDPLAVMKAYIFSAD